MANCIVCTDKDKLIKELTEERNEYKELYLNAHDQEVKKDYIVQNQKVALDKARNTLELYENENRALRNLVRLWV